jgi:hypothetical protein
LELYIFQKENPQFQDRVNAKLATHGINFRIYIRRSLTRIAEDRGESLPAVAAGLEEAKPSTFHFSVEIF